MSAPEKRTVFQSGDVLRSFVFCGNCGRQCHHEFNTVFMQCKVCKIEGSKPNS